MRRLIRSTLSGVLGSERARRLRRPAFWGNVRRTAPLSTHWGFHRGTPIDRVYLERWIAGNRRHISGSVIEVKDSDLVTRFGSGLTRVDVLDIDPANPAATIVADLAEPGALARGAYDCAVVTQVLQYVSSPATAAGNLIDSLRPGGTLLLSVPGVSPCEHESLGNDRWRFLIAGVEQILGDASEGVDVETSISAFGNAATVLGVAAGTVAEDGFGRYIAAEDDPHYPLLICARVTRTD